MSDYRVTFKVTNARIKRAMNAAGINTVSELCRRMGNAENGAVGQLVNLKQPARKINGEWRSLSLKIAEALGCLPEDLFSSRQQVAGLKKTIAERDFEENAIEVFLEQNHEPRGLLPDLSIERSDASAALDAALSLLTPVQQRVIRGKYGLGNEPAQTNAQLAQQEALSEARIWQIEKRALRRLKLYAHTGQLPRDIVMALIDE